MFLDEARLAARLNHPNIVHTYEVGEQNGVYFIAMEYLEGQSLNKVLKEALRRKEMLEPEVCVRIVADALAGLGHAHELRDYDGRPLQIIHRDVSPHNIFVTYDGHTKLVDFGIAKAALSSTETEVGVLKGKVAYMSPEQAMGGRIDCRSDLFAMGIVLWELLAHQRLMTGDNAANTLHKLMNEPIPRLSQVMPSVDPHLDAIVARALEKDPTIRFQSAAEMREALEAWLSRSGRPFRQDDVARRMMALFGNVREEVQRQVQRHMSAITTAANTQELQALTAESLKRMEQSGANVSGQLLRLGVNGSGSGSGVVPSYGGSRPSGATGGYAPMGSSASMPASQAAPAPKANNSIALVALVGFFFLAAVAIVVLGLRKKDGQSGNLATGPTASSTVSAAPTPFPIVTGEPTATASAVPTGTTTSPEPSASTVAAKNPPPKQPIAVRPPSAPTTKATVVAPPPPPPPEKEEPGFLTINSYPWAKVTENGRVICAATPCSRVQLPPGNHTLLLENSEQGFKQSVSVTIKSGETTTRAVAFK
jgi:serine/threonine-protein kinase